MSRFHAKVLVPVALMLAIEAFVLLALATRLLPWDAVPASDAFLPEFRRALHPEAQERFLYLLGLLCVPTLPLACLALLKHLGARYSTTLDRFRDRPVAKYWDIGLLATVLMWLGGLSLNSEIPAASRYLLLAMFAAASLPLMRRSLCGVPASSARLQKPQAALERPTNVGRLLNRPLRHSPAVLLIAFSAGLLFVTEDLLRPSHADMPHCLDVPLGAINQVLHGRTILVDTSSQYGVLYPYFGALFLACCGPRVANASLFFVLLSALTLLFLYLALARKFRSPVPAVLAFAAVVGLSHPYWAWSLQGFPDYFHIPYYQYFPIRTVGGAFFLWYVAVYLARPTWKRRWFGFLAAGFSALWNTDTGLVILVAWTGLLVYDQLARAAGWRERARGVLGPGLGLVLTLGLALAAYTVFAWLRTGAMPQLVSYIRFQKIYYLNGFGMAPGVVWEFWQPVVLVYLLTVFNCLRRWQTVHADRGQSWYLYIALYGLGIFSYYQGRNDIRNLLATCYPAVFLCCCWTYDCARRLRGAGLRQIWGQPSRRLVLVHLVAFGVMSCLGLVSFVAAAPSAVAYARELARGVGIPPSNPLLALLARQDLNGRELIICSDRASYLHLHTHSWSALPFSSTSEVVLVDDVRLIQDLLVRRGPQVIAFRDQDGAFTQLAKHLDFTTYRIVREQDGVVLLESSRATGGKQ